MAAVVRGAFGGAVEVNVDHRPYFLTGDFNGDRFRDLVMVVRLKAAFRELPGGVTVLDPWRTRRPSPAGPGTLALAILHGGREGLHAPPLGRYLLTDQEFFATPIWQTPPLKDLIGLVSKPRASRQGRRTLPRPAKGDAIRVATEAGIDTLLYWDGRTYRLYEPPEEP